MVLDDQFDSDGGSVKVKLLRSVVIQIVIHYIINFYKISESLKVGIASHVPMIAMLRPKPSAIDFGNILCMEILFLEDCCLQVCVCARVCILAHNMRERERERDGEAAVLSTEYSPLWWHRH